MANDKVQLFEDRPIRTAWVEDEEEWYFSIVDVVQALTESADGRKYWNKLKQRLKEEGSQLVTNCHQLKMTARSNPKNVTVHFFHSVKISETIISFLLVEDEIAFFCYPL